MSARFEYGFFCSPRVQPGDRQTILQTFNPSLVAERTSKDCNRNEKSPFKSTAYGSAVGPRTHL
jgi:hypothetical protein